MAPMSNPTYIKITLSGNEAKKIDEAVKAGHGSSRADLCRIAILMYLRECRPDDGVCGNAGA